MGDLGKNTEGARASLGRGHALVVATGNRGKLEELRALLASIHVEVLSLSEAGADTITVTEDGDTFEANAIKKAKAIAKATSMMTLADDSGLEVDVLGNKPGVRSARFAHDRATDAENNAALLDALSNVDDAPSGGFPGRFRCVLALIDPYTGGEPVIVEGACEGRVTTSPRGSGGFGYDPLFVVRDANDKTMAELSSEEKNELSHRAKAFRALVPMLESLIARRNGLIAAVRDR